MYGDNGKALLVEERYGQGSEPAQEPAVMPVKPSSGEPGAAVYGARTATAPAMPQPAAA
jgi:hypothetical protein